MRRLSACFSVVALAAGSVTAQVWEVRNQLLTPPAGAETSASFGSALSTGDFDADGITDLAVGTIKTDPSGIVDAGRVDVFFGGSTGPQPGTTGQTGFQAYSELGYALAAGDFNGDGRDEIAASVPFWDQTGAITLADVGLVEILQIGRTSSTVIGALTQGTANVPDDPEEGDEFGWSLAVGDFNGDGKDDLAIGVPGESVAGFGGAGAVNVLYGSASGLSGTGSQFWSRSGGGIEGTAAAGDAIGSALAAGDFNGDGYADLAVGAPGSGTKGEVEILYGSSTGLGANSCCPLDPVQLGYVSSDGGGFGISLAAGDLNRSTFCLIAGSCTDDLVIGMWGAVVNYLAVDRLGAGAAFAVYGSFSGGGLDPSTGVMLTQANFSPATNTPPETSDGFGTVVAVGQLGGSSGADLAIGTPLETRSAVDDGCVHTLLSASPLTSGFAQYLVERTELASAPPAGGDTFGSSLAIGDFDHDGRGDLAVGIPGKKVAGVSGAGAVQILYGALFADGFGAGDESAWSSHVP